MKISVIIPALNEESVLERTLEHTFRLNPHELIVVDGGSEDSTFDIAKKYTSHIYRSPQGRAQQMNFGAEHAEGDLYLFLHADTMLPKDAFARIEEALALKHEAGRFGMQFDDRRFLLKLYECYTKFHLFSYGDQAFFVKKELFEKLGGFDEAAPFEDIDFYKRLKEVTRPVILKSSVITSARRFLKVGCVKQKFINMWLLAFYYMGWNVLPQKRKLYVEVR